MSYMLPFLEVHAVDHCNHRCRWCHNYSPDRPEKEYQAEEYFDGLDILKKNGVQWNLLSIMGGEPFLHSDLLNFCIKFIIRYRRPLYITTNGFWLSSENIRLYKDLWPLIDTCKFSRYPSIEKRLGGEERIRTLLKELKQYNPNIIIDWPWKYQFNELLFFEEPIPPETYCTNVECLALLTDRRMGHCGAGAYQHLAPDGFLSQGFLDSEDMFYELDTFDIHSFMLWHKRYPLDACSFCNFAQKQDPVPWRPAKGTEIFNKRYEYAYEKNLCLYLEATGDREAVNARVLKLMSREPEAACELVQVALARALENPKEGLALLEQIRYLAPTQEETVLLALKQLSFTAKQGM